MKNSNHQDVSYVAMRGDLINSGHINILTKASSLGRVVVGLLSDEAIESYKKGPFLKYEARYDIIKNIQLIDEIVEQSTLDYSENLEKFKPKYVVHGDEWSEGYQQKIRQKVIEILNDWNGELIEIPYTQNAISVDVKDEKFKDKVTSTERLNSLRKLLNEKEYLTFLDTHNPLSALVVENATYAKNDKITEFDGMWLSSLTDSTSRGKPDIEAVDFSSRFITINEILEVTTKPIIFDGDTGGLPEHFRFMVKNLERAGVSAVIIEDKIGLKRNSLFGTEAEQRQDSIESFCNKIITGKKAALTDEFMVIARIESLILEQGLNDALARAKAYIEAGSDGILIHSRQKEGKEIFEFMKKFREIDALTPLVVVPTSYNQYTNQELSDEGANIIIYANHLLRSSYPSMANTAKSILKNQRSTETDDSLMSIKEILNLIPES
tara:strand:- start:1742 stop:3055 length:1314 start_codon:yes stop_codon:yes gene_type:complete